MGFIDEIKRLARPYEEEDEEFMEDEYEEEAPRTECRERALARSEASFPAESDRRSNKVVNIHTTTQLQFVLVKP